MTRRKQLPTQHGDAQAASKATSTEASYATRPPAPETHAQRLAKLVQAGSMSFADARTEVERLDPKAGLAGLAVALGSDHDEAWAALEASLAPELCSLDVPDMIPRIVPMSNDEAHRALLADTIAHLQTTLVEMPRVKLARAPSSARCDMGVGCDEYGTCYAHAQGRPEMCPKHDSTVDIVISLRAPTDEPASFTIAKARAITKLSTTVRNAAFEATELVPTDLNYASGNPSEPDIGTVLEVRELPADWLDAPARLEAAELPPAWHPSKPARREPAFDCDVCEDEGVTVDAEGHSHRCWACSG